MVESNDAWSQINFKELMKDYFIQYILHLYNAVPKGVNEALLSVLAIGTVAIIVLYGIKIGFLLKFCNSY